MTDIIKHDAGRDNLGRFAPGNSGRPKGTRPRSARLAEEMMAGDVEGIVRKVIDAAKGGDMVAAKIVLDRLLPVRRGSPVLIDLPDTATPAGIAAAYGTVMRAVGEGELSPEEAQSVSSLLEGVRRGVETVELAERITALEGKMHVR